MNKTVHLIAMDQNLEITKAPKSIIVNWYTHNQINNNQINQVINIKIL